MGNFSNSVFEVIDMRSFSNLWYWIALAVMWSTVSHWVLGVPFDMVSRARRNGDAPMADLERLTDINVNRLLYISGEAGAWLVALFCFILSGLATVGFVLPLNTNTINLAKSKKRLQPHENSDRPKIGCIGIT